MNAELQALKKSPRLPEYVENLKAFLNAERQRRQQFYEQISENDKAEFISGEAVFHSPVKKKHLDASEMLSTLLSVHCKVGRLGVVFVEKMMIELTRNSYEPDICFFERKRAAKFEADQMLFPAPDFVVEIVSKSTEKTDRGIKFDDYAAHGIKEYWIVDPTHQTVEQYWLAGRHYGLNFKGKDADVESKVVKGFRIPVRAIFDEK
ncbi:MAG: Uma2 family endonuclease [Cytophagaceae bacterium]|nr:Uma2 family endonuclease [Cytophagaceae bacterium]